MVAIGVGPACIREEVREAAPEGLEQPHPEEQGDDEVVEDVVRTHRHAPGRHRRPLPNALRRMGQEALEHRSAEARPDQPLRDVRVRGVELVQVGVRLPLFETEFDLPPELIEPLRGQVAEESARGLTP